jgi:hypothetical protein
MISINLLIIHSKLVEVRKNMVMALVEKLQKANLFKVAYAFIEDFETEQITKELIHNSTNLDKINDGSVFDSALSSLHTRNISNSFKHAKAISWLADNASDDSINIIIEDDVLFGDAIDTLLHSAVAQLPPDFEFIFLGLPSTTTKPPNGFNYEKFSIAYNIAPCCESYIISKSCARKMKDSFFPIKFTTNIQLSFIIQKQNINAYFIQPNLFIDGSKFGVYLSSVEANNTLVMNPEYHQLKAILDKATLSAEDFEKVKILKNTMKFRNHPDIIALLGMHEWKQNNVDQAKTFFESAFKVYKANNCLMNNQSNFLRAYIEMYKSK